jgi:hypothetical protein
MRWLSLYSWIAKFSPNSILTKLHNLYVIINFIVFYTMQEFY